MGFLQRRRQNKRQQIDAQRWAQRWARVEHLMEPGEEKLHNVAAVQMDKDGFAHQGTLLLSDRALYGDFEVMFIVDEPGPIRIPLRTVYNVDWRPPQRLGVQYMRADGQDFLIADLHPNPLSEALVNDLKLRTGRS